ncbi:RDD family protein [candidate division KSB1 bacterium]|nr:RDD family protein [candidate division KSB1 bacterium]NIR70311.1 RDD family protein [candidate division KSB1 bacterium]NIS27615.1 RDD family protein [candidate division KSB1 bacterium]NIT74455.1 RDD family protein [candidate division KSB1 bacterium]NIU28980.1 RDD family protein [candidate division KSB1 bacterium]
MLDSVKIQTTQNVEIDYTIAGIGDRVLAALLDYLVLAGYLIGGTFLLGTLSPGSGASTGFVALMVILYLPAFLYHLLCEIFLNGQSFGKKTLKIKVVKLDGSQPRIGDYFLRWILRLIDITILFGSVAMLTIIITGKGQRIGDIAAGTTVVKLNPEVTLDDTILESLEDHYQPVFSQVTALSDSDISTIKKVLKVKVENSKIANHLAYKTKIAIEEKMGVKSDMLPPNFLETVLKDYNYYTAGGS